MFLSTSEKRAVNLLALRLEHDLVEIGKLMPGSLKFCILRHIQLYAVFFYNLLFYLVSCARNSQSI